MIRICIVDDHAMVRAGLKRIIAESGKMEVVAEAGNATELFLLTANKKATWDVMLLDLSLPGRGGLEILKKFKTEHPEVAILILTMQNVDQYALRAFKAGASGFLTKDCASEELLTAIERIASGEKYIKDQIAEKLVNSLASESDKPKHHTLSDREFEVLVLLSKGKSISDIGKELILSVKTISTYRTRILEKLQLQNNADLIHYVINHKIQ